LFLARAYLKLNNESEAEKAYAVVLESASGELAAEALYYSAYFEHKKGNYEASTEAVKNLTKNYARFQQFGFKGLILMAKNFYALDDAFNATYILESLEKSATKYPKIVAEAKQELTKMKQEISEKNSSVEVDSDKN
jgi:tetratricopeptide (TPR) repeat protein